MAPTGRSGANDAEVTGMGNLEGAADVADTEMDALGEPIGIVEVFELETLEPAASSPESYENDTWFRWWYVPAVVAPLAGATAAFLLLRRRRRETAPVAAYKAAVQQSRDWLETVRSGKATQSAVNALQQGAASVRESAKNLPDAAVALRDRSGEIVGAVATTAAAKQATQSVRGAVDSVTNRWNTNAPKAQRAAREQARNALKASKAARRSAFSWFVSGQAQKVAQAQATRASKALEKAKPAVTAARANASKNAAKAAARTNRTAQRANKSVRRAMNRTQAFAFGALVTATLTYARGWRKRLMEREMRETAGGRMVRD